MIPAKYRLTWWDKNSPEWAKGFQEAVRELKEEKKKALILLGNL